MGFAPQSHKMHEVPQRDLSSENALSKIIVDCAFKVHTKIGPGLLESAYKECMEKEFIKRKVNYKRQFEKPIFYDDEQLKTPYRVDFLIDNKVIVEKLLPIHQAQTLTYLKLSNLNLALLVNFNVPLIKEGIKRLVN
jgi:GxxExxY protein